MRLELKVFAHELMKERTQMADKILELRKKMENREN